MQWYYHSGIIVYERYYISNGTPRPHNATGRKQKMLAQDITSLQELITFWNERHIKTVRYSESAEKRTATAAKHYTYAELAKVAEQAPQDATFYSAMSYRNVRQVLEDMPEQTPQEPEQEPEQEAQDDEQAPEQAPQEATGTGVLEALLGSMIEQKIKAVAPTLKGAAREIKITTPAGTHEIKGIVHEAFELILASVHNDREIGRSPYLVGPAGTGKNVICKQVAEALGLKFYYQNCITEEYKLTGYMDANGNYHSTPFYDAFKNGGLYMLDELDGSDASALLNINAALANGYFSFPNNELVTMHEDFHCIAAGNTIGTGANATYSGRVQLDAASLDRFNAVKVGYSKAIEDSLTDDADILAYCRAFRRLCEKKGIETVVSYRGIKALAALSKITDMKAALYSAVIKGLCRDDLDMIINDLPQDNPYTTATREIAATM